MTFSRRLSVGAGVIVAALGLGLGVATTGAAARTGTVKVTTVTQADNGHRYTLHKGTVLDVQLTGPSGVAWSEPESSNDAVLERTTGSSGMTAMATFIATSKGRVQVTAVGTPSCAPLCTVLLGFEVNVRVIR